MNARQKQRKKNDPEKQQSDNLWWKNVFDQKYIDTYVDISTPESTSEELSFIKSLVLPKSKILDLGCGYGRHAIPLANAGYFVIGFDQSHHFLNLAQKTAEAQNIPLKLIEGDMRKPVNVSHEFDAVISMFSSFGYFSNVNDDVRVLKNIHKVLRKNGIFLLDLNNAFRTISQLSRKGTYDSKTKTIATTSKDILSNGLAVTTVRVLDLSTQRLQMSRKWHDANGDPKHYDAFFTLYTPHEIRTLLSLTNFEVTALCGDFVESPYTLNSPRLIIVAEKK